MSGLSFLQQAAIKPEGFVCSFEAFWLSFSGEYAFLCQCLTIVHHMHYDCSCSSVTGLLFPAQYFPRAISWGNLSQKIPNLDEFSLRQHHNLHLSVFNLILFSSDWAVLLWVLIITVNLFMNAVYMLETEKYET